MRGFESLARRPLLALVILLLGAALAAAGALPSGRAALDSLASLLPQGPVVVDILAPHYSERVERIAGRMQAAARSDPAWFQAWTRSHPRPPLPWHPNLGVTRAEYQEYLLGSRDAPMAVAQRATLRFDRQSGRRIWRLSGWGKLTPVNGLVIDLERNQLDGKRGVLQGMGVAEPEQGSDAPLAWGWYGVWKASHVVGDPLKGGQAMNASLHLGPLGDGSRVGLYWTYRRYNNGARLDDEFLLLRFTRPR